VNLSELLNKSASRLVFTEAAPFMLTRLVEVGSDFGMMLMLSRLGSLEEAASPLISTLQAFFRGIFATNLFSFRACFTGDFDSFIFWSSRFFK